MKVILFTDSLGAGGAQRQLVGLAIMLKTHGHTVKVSTYFNFDFYKQQLDDAYIPNELIPGADNTKKRILAVRSYFKKEAPDWVIAYQETPSLVACAARVLGCRFKLIVSERNTTQVVGMNEHVRFFLYRWADVIVPNSYAQEKWLKEHYPWMAKKIATITNFVDLQKFHYIEHTRREAPLIMVAASAMQSKNVIGLIKAAKIMCDKGLKFCINWYGLIGNETDYQRECHSLIHALHIENNFHLLPKTQEIQKKYQDADYFCLPSFFEGTPNVICEAIATGVPVMCSNICDNPNYVVNGKNGVLFEPNTPSDIADKIQQLITQTESQYQTYRKESRAIAENLLAQNVFIEKYLKIINRL